MSGDRAPYSRVYWTIRNDPRLLGIYPNDAHLATWMRLLLAADMSWPAPADIPSNVSRKSLEALESAGIIELVAGGMFTFHGLDAERGRRREAAAASARRRYGRSADDDRTQSVRSADAPTYSSADAVRSQSVRSADAEQTQTERTASRAEPSRAETRGFTNPSTTQGARANGRVDPQPEDVFVEVVL